MLLQEPKTIILKRIRISSKKRSLLVKCFALDMTATQTGKLVNLNRNTVNRYYTFLRYKVLNQALQERHDAQIKNGVEIDESYFGPTRQRGKRGRGAGKKILVLGLLKRHGKVFAEIVPDATREELLPIIRQTVTKGADIYTDGWRSYDALAIYGYNHKKVNHQKNEFAKGDIHINGVESFWSWTKRRLAKFNGIAKKQFSSALLESEWRFNHRDDIVQKVRKLARLQRAK